MFLNSKITSLDRPYEMSCIFEVEGSGGGIYLSIAPGRKDNIFDRDLELDLQRITKYGIQIIICLLEWSELYILNISQYPRLAQQYGFIFYHFPIKDGNVPKENDLLTLIEIIETHLYDGHKILIHCKAGLGRAGTICACSLVKLGYNHEDAIFTTRQHRPKSIQNKKQEQCIENYYNMCYTKIFDV